MRLQVPTWPTEGGITREIASETCQTVLQLSQAASTCSPLVGTLTLELSLESCLTDVQVSVAKEGDISQCWMNICITIVRNLLDREFSDGCLVCFLFHHYTFAVDYGWPGMGQQHPGRHLGGLSTGGDHQCGAVDRHQRSSCTAHWHRQQAMSWPVQWSWHLCPWSVETPLCDLFCCTSAYLCYNWLHIRFVSASGLSFGVRWGVIIIFPLWLSKQSVIYICCQTSLIAIYGF